jgi:hypothetical protein
VTIAGLLGNQGWDGVVDFSLRCLTIRLGAASVEMTIGLSSSFRREQATVVEIHAEKGPKGDDWS